MADNLTPEDIADWLEQAPVEQVRTIGRPATVERLLYAARETLRADEANARVRELGEEVDDVLRRYTSERAPH
jgi:hypothetical protein